MNDRLGVFLWTFGGGLAFAVVGAAFGGLTGGVNARHGRTGGTVIGRRIARAIEGLFRRPLSEFQRGVLVGATDGAIFLGLVGIVLGLIADRADYDPEAWLVPIFLILVGAAVLAAIFGMIAFGMSSRGWQSLGGVVFGGLAGMLVAILCIGRDHLVPSAVCGMVLGAIIVFSRPRKRSD